MLFVCSSSGSVDDQAVGSFVVDILIIVGMVNGYAIVVLLSHGSSGSRSLSLMRTDTEKPEVSVKLQQVKIYHVVP